MKRLAFIVVIFFSVLQIRAQALRVVVTPQVVGSDLHIEFSMANVGALSASIGALDLPITLDTVGLDMTAPIQVIENRFGSSSSYYFTQQATMINSTILNFTVRPDYTFGNPLLVTDPSEQTIMPGESLIIGTVVLPIKDCKPDLALGWVPLADPQAGARLDWTGLDLDPIISRNVPPSPFAVNAPSLVVSNTDDSGCGSLRNAVETANNNPGPDVIDMQQLFPYDPVLDIIDLLSPITFTDDQTTFYFGPNATCATKVIIQGTGAFDGFILDNVTGVEITNFNIRGFENGVLISGGSENILRCNFIGTNYTATAAAPNVYGVHIVSSSSNLIGDTTTNAAGNVISGNTADGVFIEMDSPLNVVSSNVIGTNAGATAALPNGGNGVFISNSPQNLIGSLRANGPPNVISGNGENGIEISGSTQNRVLGNLIGTGQNGNTQIFNVGDGVNINSFSSSNFVGDTARGRGNIISGNRGNGVTIDFSLQNVIASNLIGLGVDGTTPLGNNKGVYITGGQSVDNVIGNPNDQGNGNIISRNGSNGIHIEGSPNTQIFRNYLGVATDSSQASNGASNILLNNGAVGTAIGLNGIAYAGNHGIEVDGGATTTNNVWGVNSIFSNTNDGIFFANGTEQNSIPRPVISLSGNVLSGTGARANARIQIFVDSTDEGQVLIDTAIANGSGDWSKPLSVALLQAQVAQGRSFITAIQTDPLNVVSSPFSLAEPICIPPVADIQDPNGTGWEFCDGDVLSVTSTFVSGATYNFYFENSGNPVNNVVDSTAFIDASDFPSSTTDNLIVEVTSGVCVNTDTVSVTMLSAIQVDLGPDTLTCAPVNIDLVATPFSGFAYSWNLEGGPSTTFTVDEDTFAISQPGKYFVRVQSASGGCQTSDSIVVSTHPTMNIPNVVFFSANSNSVTFAWDSVGGAADYTLFIDTCRYRYQASCTALPAINVPNSGPFRYTQTGLSVGDSVIFSVQANGICGGVVNGGPATGVADSCNANFSGLDSDYCTASFLSRLYPAYSGGTFTASPVLNAVKYSGSFYYFDPAEAGPGDHWVYYENCNGVIDSMMTTVLPAPCVTEVVNDSTASAIQKPQGIYTDCDGQIYASSADKNVIVKIDTFGVASVIAGDSTMPGNLDGPVGIATLEDPIGLAVLPDGTVFFVNSADHTIRMVSGGVVSTIAGTKGLVGCSCPGDDGIGAAAFFRQPYGLALSKDLSTLYVTDNNRLRSIDLTTYQVTTLAGSGAAGDGSGLPGATFFDRPTHVVADANYVYVTDKNNGKIKRYNISTTVTEDYAFTGGFLPPYEGHKDNVNSFAPRGISIDENGGLFVADESLCSITRIEDDTVSLFAGDFGDCTNAPPGDALSSRFRNPDGLSVFSKGFLDVSDAGNNTIKRIAINDFLKSPLKALDSTYCQGEPTDTLASSTNTVGLYSGTGIVNTGTHWVFQPNTPGTYDICYDYEIGYCSESLCFEVTVAPNPVVNLGLDTSVICGAQYGTDSLKVDSSYTAAWAVDGTPDATNTWFRIMDVAPAEYTVSIVDTNGCTAADTLYLSLSQSVVDAGGGNTPIEICENETDTISNATINGSLVTPPGFTINWTPSVGLNRVDTLHPVVSYSDTTLITYYLSVTDTAGCVETDSIKYTIFPEATVMAQAVTPADTVVCSGTVVPITANPGSVWTNLNPFQWSPSTDLDNPTWRTPNTTVNDTITYTVVFTDDNGCTAEDSVTLYPVDITGTITLSLDTACVGTPITATATVLNSPNNDLQYNWEGQGFGLSNTFNFILTNPIDSVITVEIIDNDISCATNLTLQDTVFANTLSITMADSIGICNDDTASVTASYSGTLSPVTVTWTTPSLLDYIDDATSLTPRIRPANLGSNKFYLDVAETGGANCNVRDSIIIYLLDPLSVSAATAPVVDTLFCIDRTTDIQLNATPSAGATWATAPTPFVWSPTTDLDNAIYRTPLSSTKDTITYYVDFTDDYGCTARDSVTLYPVELDAEMSFTLDTACVGDVVTASVTVTGSPLGLLTYNWEGQGFGAANTFVVNMSTRRDSIISVEVYDATTGCSYIETDTIFINRLQIDLVDYAEVCFIDSVDVTATISNGIPPYNITWSSPAVTATPVDQATTKLFPTTVGSTYLYIDVTESGSATCSLRDSIEVNKLPEVSIEVTTLDSIICFGTPETATLNPAVLVGNAGGSFNWRSDDGSFNLTTFGSVNVSPNDTTKYYVTYQEPAPTSCRSNTDSITIYPHAFEAFLSLDNNDVCPNDPVIASARTFGEIGPVLSYSWNGAVPYVLLNNTTVQYPATAPVTVQVVDSTSLCTADATIDLIVKDMSVAIDNFDPETICFGDTLRISAAVTGGNPAYTFNWRSSNTTANTDVMYNQQDAGASSSIDVSPEYTDTTTYYIEVTDSPVTVGGASCTVIDSIKVFMNTEIIADAGVDTVICVNEPMARLGRATGGQTPYNYQWGFNSTTQNAQSLSDAPTADTEYVLTVTDNQGCFDRDTMQLTLADLTVNVYSQFDGFCPGTRDTVYVEALNGSGNYEYSFNGGAFQPDSFLVIFPTVDVTVNVLVRDVTGCSKPGSVLVNVEDFSIELGPDKYLCSDLSDPVNGNSGYAVNSTLIGGSLPFQSITWDVTAASPALSSSADVDVTNVDPLNPRISPNVGTTSNNWYEYYIVIVDDAGCTTSDTVRIFHPEVLSTFVGPIVSATATICDGENYQLGYLGGTGVPTPTQGGVPPYNISWVSNPATTNVDGLTDDNPIFFSSLASGPGTYTFTKTVVDDAGCTATYLGAPGQTMTVNVVGAPDVEITIDGNPLPAGKSVDYCTGSTFTLEDIAVNSSTVTHDWKHPGAVGTTISTTTTVTTAEHNDQPGWYHLRVEDATCFREDSVFMNQLPLETVTINPISGTICSNESFTLGTTYSPTGGSFNWSHDGAGSISFLTPEQDSIRYTPGATEATPLTFNVTYDAGCVPASDVFAVNTTPAPTVGIDLSATTIESEDSITVFDNSSYTANFWTSGSWYFFGGSPDSAVAVAPFDQHDVYYASGGTYPVCLSINEDTGCGDSTCVSVTVIGNDEVVYIPNVLSPFASNPENRVAKVYGSTVSTEDFKFEVYNRWGELVFETDDFTFMNTQGWNGLNQNTGVIEQNGVFTYVVKMKMLSTGSVVDDSGTITVLK